MQHPISVQACVCVHRYPSSVLSREFQELTRKSQINRGLLHCSSKGLNLIDDQFLKRWLLIQIASLSKKKSFSSCLNIEVHLRDMLNDFFVVFLQNKVSRIDRTPSIIGLFALSMFTHTIVVMMFGVVKHFVHSITQLPRTAPQHHNQTTIFGCSMSSPKKSCVL